MVAGRGGNGALSFRREKFVPKGGPDGGDGGEGGDVVLVADPDLRDLSRFRPNQWVKGGRGGSGGGANKHGANGELVELRRSRRHADLRRGRAADRGSRPRAGARRRRAWREWRTRQPALRDAGPSGAALRRDGDARRRGDDRAPSEAPRGRGARRSAERREVVAPSPHLEREAEGGGVPVHDARAGARDRRLARGPPAHRRRRSGTGRRRERGRRARPRVPRAPRARAPARCT